MSQRFMQDSTYQSETHTDWLSERGIEHRLIKHAYRKPRR
jgi:hypothetical protein